MFGFRLIKRLCFLEDKPSFWAVKCQRMKLRPVIILLLLPIISCCWWFVVPNLYHFHPLYKIIIKGDIASLQSRLKEHPGEASYNNGWIGFAVTPLGLAAENNDTNMIAFLLDHGAAIEDKHSYRNQCTALHCAAARGNIAAIAFLLSRGANVNSLDRDNETPLHYAAELNHPEAVSYLIAHGADINARSNYYNRTALEVAVSDQRLEAARVLLGHGAEADFDKLIASTKSDMDWAPLASPARRDQWLKTIALLQEFKEKRHAR
jgi:ankyrin repeat protein